MSYTCSIPTSDYRSLKIPFIDLNGKIPKSGVCYVKVTDLPLELSKWLKVNPRIPQLTKNNGKLKGTVAKGIITTLESDPTMMSLKNNGITILVNKVDFHKQPGGQGYITIELSDIDIHGVANGGHTLSAIFQTREGSSSENLDKAYVKLHIYEGLNSEMIPDIAEGLNRSMQVDNASLENLKGTFDEIRNSVKGKLGAEQIAYRQGDDGEVDVHYLLTLMAMLDRNFYNDRKKNPNNLFRQPKAVLTAFSDESIRLERAKEKGEALIPVPAYKILVPHLHDILSFSDRVMKKMAKPMANFGNKKSLKTKGERARAQKFKDIPAFFDGGKIGANIHLGWLYPVISSFRANINMDSWADGKLEWLIDPDQLLEDAIDELCEIIQKEHTDNNSMPAEVGRKEAAYRGCYQVIMMELMSKGHLIN